MGGGTPGTIYEGREGGEGATEIRSEEGSLSR